MSQNFLKGKLVTGGGASSPTTDMIPILIDGAGRLMVATSTGIALEAKPGDDAASGGPYYLLTDTSGQLMLGSDGANPFVLFTDPSGRLDVICEGHDSGGTAYPILVDTDGRLILANHTTATRSNRVEEIDPISEKYVGETLCDVTNYNGPATFDYFFDMAGYRYFTLQGKHEVAAVDTLTITVEATVQDDGTDPASCEYIDVTNSLFGVANWVDTDFIAVVDTPVAFKYVHLKVVVAGGNDDADLTTWLKRMW